MQSRNSKLSRWSGMRVRTGNLVLAAVLAVLAGCATVGGGKPDAGVPSLPVAESALPEKGPTVTRLEAGREGFIITEIPRMDAESRSDFDDAVVLLNQGAYEPAVGLLERVIERSPNAAAPYINLALALVRLGRLEQAEGHLQTALNLVPDHPVAGQEYGLLLRKSGRFAESRTIYEKTLKTFPEYFPVRKNLGILCDLYLNDPSCALEQYELYSDAVPEDEQVKIWIADLRIRLNRN